MNIKILDEPSLVFGNGKHVCPKAGIELMGVYDTNNRLRKSELSIGIVGRGVGIDLLDEWIEYCEYGVDSKESSYPNLFRGFGGFSQRHGFHAKLLHGSEFNRTIQKSELSKIIKLNQHDQRVQKTVELYYEEIRFLAENRRVDVIVCVIPDDLFKSLTNIISGTSDEDSDNTLENNFRRQLKAKSMHLRVPLQLVLESTLTTKSIAQNLQDIASRSWNFFTALYYKGNKTIPWRLEEEEHKPKTCYIGIGFYNSRDKTSMSTSLAQVFDEFGHGVILRGSPVSIDKKDRRPFMSENQAFELLDMALSEYDHALMQMPARVVIHKTSNFRDSEIEGFNEAISSARIRAKDYVSVLSSDIRLFNSDNYPPPRGTLLSLSETRGILYTRGFVDFYKTYPGMYVPSPLDIRLFEHDSSLDDICKEILGLTKMNWNNTQLDGKLPITLECARRVGNIMKYVAYNEKPQASYAFYM